MSARVKVLMSANKTKRMYAGNVGQFSNPVKKLWTVYNTPVQESTKHILTETLQSSKDL